MRNWVPAGSIRVDLRSYACALALVVGALTTQPLLGQLKMETSTGDTTETLWTINDFKTSTRSTLTMSPN